MVSPCRNKGKFDTHAAHSIYIPKTEEEWNAVPPVDEGTSTFYNNSPEGNFVRGLLDERKIDLTILPDKLRNLYPFLHRFKRSSFRNWWYRIRGEARSGDAIKAPSAAAQRLSTKASAQALQVAVPTPEVTVASVAHSYRTTKSASAKSVASFFKPRTPKRPPVTPDAEDEEAMEADDATDYEIDPFDPLSLKLPYRIAEWDDEELVRWNTVIVWMPSGGYYWEYDQTPTMGYLRIGWPSTWSHKAFSTNFNKKASEKTKHNREHGIQVALKELKDTSETVVWSEMKIPMMQPVVQDPDVRFLEALADGDKLGEQYFGCGTTFYDRYLTVDLRTPSCTFQERKKLKTAFFTMDSKDDDLLAL